MHRFNRTVAISLAVISSLLIASAVCRADSFAFQGKLKQSGVSVDGLVDLKFTLFDGPSGGASTIAGPLLFANVDVVEGLFVVDVDFGANAFDGNDRWIGVEIASPVGSPTFVAVTPRQAVLPTPYAMHAQSVGALPSVYSDPISFTNASNQFSGNGAGLGGLSASGIATGNLGIARMPTGGAWSLGQNLNIDSNTLFINPTANTVAIGTSGPANKLHLQGNGNDAFGLFGDSVSGVPRIHFRATDTGHDWILRHANGSFHLQDEFSPGNEVMTWIADGKVGIGTTTPGTMLEVKSSTATAIRAETDGTQILSSAVLGINHGTSGYGVLGIHRAFAVAGQATEAGGYGGYFLGRGYFRDPVMIGDAFNPINVSTLLTISSETTGFGGMYINTDPLGEPFYGYAINGSPVAYHYYDDDDDIWKLFSNGNTRLTVEPNGRMNIPTGQDTELASGGFLVLGTVGSSNLSIDNNEIQARTNGAPNNLHLNASGGDVIVSLNSNSKLVTPVLQITGGSDLSEQFEVASTEDRTIQPGMVVCIDSASPGKLVLSNAPYAKTVAGIISGAGGVNTGMMMGQTDSIADGTHPVALSGRVYCFVDATESAVAPGDLLTTSSTPGHAMKATEESRCHGAIIGKAMTSLPQGERGLVLVLVSLH